MDESKIAQRRMQKPIQTWPRLKVWLLARIKSIDDYPNPSVYCISKTGNRIDAVKCDT